MLIYQGPETVWRFGIFPAAPAVSLLFRTAAVSGRDLRLRPSGHRAQVPQGKFPYPFRRRLPHLPDEFTEITVSETVLNILDGHVGDAERPVKNTHYLADHDIFHQRELLHRDGFAPEPLYLGEYLCERIFGELRPHLRGRCEIAAAVEIDHRRIGSVGISALFAQVVHEREPK